MYGFEMSSPTTSMIAGCPVLAVTIGNLWVLLANASVRNAGFTAWIESTGISVAAFQMFFFAGFALLAALLFGLYAKRYPLVENYRPAG